MTDKITLKNNDTTAVIDCLGAELRSLMRGGTELLWNGDPAVWAGQAPLLFPICGGLKEDKFIYEGKEYSLEKHGFARRKVFELESHTDSTAVFLLRSDHETIEHYPFENELRVRYELDSGTLNVVYSVSNTGSGDMYFSIGAHEAYACPEGIEDYSVIFEYAEDLNCVEIEQGILSHRKTSIAKGCSELPMKNEYFAIDALVFDDLKSRKATLKNRRTGKCITVEYDGFNFLLLWTKPGAKYLCIEPWCGIPDYIDGDFDITKKRGMIHLKKGENWSVAHKITF